MAYIHICRSFNAKVKPSKHESALVYYAGVTCDKKELFVKNSWSELLAEK